MINALFPAVASAWLAVAAFTLVCVAPDDVAPVKPPNRPSINDPNPGSFKSGRVGTAPVWIVEPIVEPPNRFEISDVMLEALLLAVVCVPVKLEISADRGLPVPPTTPLIKLVKFDKAVEAFVFAVDAVLAVPVRLEISDDSGLPVPPTTPLMREVKFDNAVEALVFAVLAVDAVPVKLEMSADKGLPEPPTTPLMRACSGASSGVDPNAPGVTVPLPNPAGDPSSAVRSLIHDVRFVRLPDDPVMALTIAVTDANNPVGFRTVLMKFVAAVFVLNEPGDPVSVGPPSSDSRLVK